ncbi:IS4 family transposase [Kitasatospora atroaurantiaca]|uniref:IS4 family transposase n=1 Tax=Kitasatospora atroaurantiaca TaxID=285545 RepID=A0A561EHZ4_9ACTN|nr:IS4 family transposase [Kitasatospora atroaurantiaca]
MLPPAPERRSRYPGRLRVPDRAALAGIMYVLRTGAAWRDVPAETVGCSGVTAWRRLRNWTESRRLAPPARRSAERTASRGRSGPGRLRRGRVPRPSPQRGESRGPSPVDRVRAGSKHHLIVDRHGTPLAVTLTGGNRHDVTQLLALLDAVQPIRGLRGRPRRRPRRLYADRGYDFDRYRRLLWKRGVKPLIARRGVAHGSGLGKVRWVVERAFAWLHQFKRLRTRYERRAGLHQGLLELAFGIICLRRLRTAF